MVLYKNFQRNNFNLNTHQTRSSFKYLLLASAKTVQINNHFFHNSFKQSSSRIFLAKDHLITNLKLKLLNFKKNFNLEKFSIKNKFLKTSTCLATISKPNQQIEKTTTSTKNNYFDFKNLNEQFSSLSLSFKRFLQTSSNFKSLNNKNTINFSSNYHKTDLYHRSFFQYLNEFYEKFNLIFRKFNEKYNNFKFNIKFQFDKKYILSLSATGGIFTWDKFKITNEEIKSEVDEILTLFDLKNSDDTLVDQSLPEKVKIDFETSRTLENSEWKLIYDKKDLIIWRRNFVLHDDDETDSKDHTNYDLYEYKVLGRLNDITPIEFYQTQLDLEYRKEWDYLVISLDIVDKDTESNTELVRWTMRFPYPLNPREYMYVRRYCVDPAENLLILVSRSIPNCKIEPHNLTAYKENEHDDLKKTKVLNKHHNVFHNQGSHQHVRVTKYKSNMIIIPHGEFDKPGLDYVIQYYDVNKAKIPKLAYKWMATSGLPDFIDKLHKATLKLKHRNEKKEKSEADEQECDILSKFEVLYLNKPVVECEANIGEEVIKVEDSETQIENENIQREIDEPKEVLDPNTINVSGVLKEDGMACEKNQEDILKLYLILVIQKVYYDFFHEHDEPNPIFYN